MQSRPIIYAAILVVIAGLLVFQYKDHPMNPLGKYINQYTGEALETVPASAPQVAAEAPQAKAEAPQAQQEAPAATQQTAAAPDFSVDANGLSKATAIVQTAKGIIKFKFYSKDAPQTVARIAQLIQTGFYNGLTFHRVEPGFVIQGGDPVGNGTGGSGQKINAEFNIRKHLEGTVAMARASDPNSADSQFYITLSPQPRLDKQYTVFGQVIEGMDIVKRISKGDSMTKVWIQ